MIYNTQLPKISVITPSYNQGEFIEETIKSVVTQNYPNLEYIIVDGGSTDNSVEIIKKYAKKYPNIIKWISGKDKGQSDAINKGLRMSTGEIMGILSSDDIYLPKTLWKVYKAFIEYPTISWLIGGYIIIDSKGKQIRQIVKFYKTLLRKTRRPKLLFIANYIPYCSVFLRKTFQKKVGFFDTTLHFANDYDFWVRATLLTPPKLIGETFSAFRIHSHSKNIKNYKNILNEEVRALKKNEINRIWITGHQLHSLLVNLYYLIYNRLPNFLSFHSL